MMAAALGQVASERLYCNPKRLARHHSLGATLGDIPHRRALEIENASLVAENGSDLLALNLADGVMVRQNGKNRNQSVLTQLWNVVVVAIEQAPCDAGRDRRFGDLRHTGAHRLD